MKKLLGASLSEYSLKINSEQSIAEKRGIEEFSRRAKEWRDNNPDKKGNIRDYATINELICLSNMENINAVLISDGLSQPQRLRKLNQIAISQN